MIRENKSSSLRQGLNTCESKQKERTQQLTGGEERKATKATKEMERGKGADELKGKNIGELKDTGGGLSEVKKGRNGGGEALDPVGGDGSSETNEPTKIEGARQGILKRPGKQSVAPPGRQEL